MPETAPLDVSEATVGYELDSITLRDIASVRYVRHHEWLDHLLGSPLPSSAIIPPKVTKSLNEEQIRTRTKELEEEIRELEAQKKEGWKFHLDENKAHTLSDAIRQLREDFGTGSIENAQEKVEKLLGVKIVKAEAMRPVKINYDRQQIELQQAKAAKEAAEKAAAAAQEQKDQQQQEQQQQDQQQEQGEQQAEQQSPAPAQAPRQSPAPVPAPVPQQVSQPEQAPDAPSEEPKAESDMQVE